MDDLALRERSPRGYPAERHRVVGLADALIDWSNCASEGKRLSQNAKITYELIAGFPEAWFSVVWLAARLDRAPSTARAALAELELGGWIRRERRFDRQTGGQRTNRYVILRRPGEVTTPRRGPKAPTQDLPTGLEAPESLESSDEPRPPAPEVTALEPRVNEVQDSAQESQEPEAPAELLGLEEPAQTAPELEALRATLKTVRAGRRDEADQQADAVHSGASPAEPAFERATLTLGTLQELLNAFGSQKVALLERELATPRWRVPGVAEAACRLLLERRKKTTIKFLHHYVAPLYANALERAQRTPAPPSPGIRPRPQPKGDPSDTLDQLLAYKNELHVRIHELAQQLGTENERARFQEELHRVCKRIIHRQSELERAVS